MLGSTWVYSVERLGGRAIGAAAGFGEYAVLLVRVDHPAALLEHLSSGHQALVLVSLYDHSKRACHGALFQALALWG